MDVVADRLRDSELPQLKTLASELLAAESPELDVLEQLAAVAAGVAARWREAARRRQLEQVGHAARQMFPAAREEFSLRLAQAPAEELSAIAALLEAAMAARTAFVAADAALMAARARGDYAAMAPLALEADGHKNALAAATAEIGQRLGLDAATLVPGSAAPLVDAAGAEAGTTTVDDPAADAGEGEPLLATEVPADDIEFELPEDAPHPAPVAPEDAAGAEIDPALLLHADEVSERRRLRALIRQMRPAAEEA